jgi:hypothetical protein
VNPKCHAAAIHPRPTASSTNGYITEMRSSQHRHFPRSRSQLTTGMFSIQLS